MALVPLMTSINDVEGDINGISSINDEGGRH